MPFKSLLDPSFTYRSAANTDVRLTFERVRREQEALRQCEREAAKVVSILGNAGGPSTAARKRAERRSG
jgi:hypothetical protein